MVLHKYTKANHGLSYLENGFLRFSPLSEFNDPFEMRPYIDSLGTPEQEESVIRTVEEENPWLPKLTDRQKIEILHRCRTHGLANIRSRMPVNFEATVGILCMVNNRRTDLLMWAHYADSHKGCVLEFDSSHEWFHRKHGTNPHQFMGVLQEVKYDPNRPKGSLLGIGRDDFLTKAKCWEYEREARIVLNLQDCESRIIEGKEVQGLFPVPHEALLNVFLGVNTCPSVRDEFLRLLPHDKSIGLFQFGIHEQEFALVARQIN